jgi:hypothetical protein
MLDDNSVGKGTMEHFAWQEFFDLEFIQHGVKLGLHMLLIEAVHFQQ